MGKAKKRSFERCKNLYNMCLKREDAIKKILYDLNSNYMTKETKDMISLFGINQEELSENGASWEELKLADRFIF